jgi:uncharacterized protein (TIGR03905 family)
MKHIVYQTTGTCSQQIELDIDDENRVQNVQFLGGCNGNLQGIAQLVRGMKVEDVKSRLDGIRCGYKSTSCPDQLVRALEQAE